jgi:hypothetical protein
MAVRNLPCVRNRSDQKQRDRNLNHIDIKPQPQTFTRKHRRIKTMPSTFKQHHCPGANCWIADASPGGCRPGYIGKVPFCRKHQMACRNVCPWYHLLTDPGCGPCIGASMAGDRRERSMRERERYAAKSKDNDAFWNPKKDRKPRG